MPWNPEHTPQYRLHKKSGSAVVTLGGRDFYLGTHGSAASRRKYDRLIADWLGNGRCAPGATKSVSEIILAYYSHCVGYYGKHNNKELSALRMALRPVRELYADLPAEDFGPLKLQAVRQTFVDAGCVRRHCNQQARRVVRMFRWAAARELIRGETVHALKSVEGLRMGRGGAREGAPVKPVPLEHVQAIREHVSRQVWTMIQLQLLTGMRSGEVTILRGTDLVMDGDLWEFRPAKHKTEYRGHVRTVTLGPRAQALIKPFLGLDPQAYLFSPQQAESERRAKVSAARKTPLSCGNRPRAAKINPAKTAGQRYDSGSYRRAIEYAIQKSGCPHWHPHQLRHNAATELRKRYGLDAARAILGHRSPAITETYAELDAAKAAEVMRQIG